MAPSKQTFKWRLSSATGLGPSGMSHTGGDHRKNNSTPVKMNRVRLKWRQPSLGVYLIVLLNLISITTGRHVKRDTTSTLSFEACSPFDSVFELTFIQIGSCSCNPCQITVGSEVKITGRFLYTGDDLEDDMKLLHRPNWLLNYVYTTVTVLQNVNVVSSSDQIDFEAIVYVDEGLAPLKGTLNWRLYDDEDNRIACFNIPIQLTL